MPRVNSSERSQRRDSARSGGRALLSIGFNSKRGARELAGGRSRSRRAATSLASHHLDVLRSGVACGGHSRACYAFDHEPAVYVYTHSARTHNATQRIKLDTLHHTICHDRLAHITNYVFAQGYLPAHVRSCVYWEAPYGRRLGEVAHVEELLGAGEGCSEAKALRLVIDV
ncbi:unnamed protein product [Peniophora sp. CBMAI 1063]|nr:unnamed protein product [Peniophora sp. CBMAI 1063]